jgi:hypothetical protein
MTNADGSITNAHMAATTALRLQWAFIRRDYFPEIASPIGNNGDNMVNSVCTMVQGWLDALETKVNGIASSFTAINSDLIYAWPPHGIYKAPAQLAPF